LFRVALLNALSCPKLPAVCCAALQRARAVGDFYFLSVSSLLLLLPSLAFSYLGRKPGYLAFVFLLIDSCRFLLAEIHFIFPPLTF
jgi:hypothetical protein